jgi:hypothetical protein
MIAILQGLGLSATLKAEDKNNIKYIEATLNGGVSYFALRGCTGPGPAARCDLIDSFGYFDGSGVTLDQINTVNQSKTALSTLSLDRDGDGIVSAKHFLTHGITAKHLGYRIALFYYDIDIVLGTFKPGVIAQVSHRSAVGSPGEASAAQSPTAKGFKTVNAIGREDLVFATGAVLELLDSKGID